MLRHTESSTRRDEIINKKDALAWLDRASVHLDLVGRVFGLVLDGYGLTCMYGWC